MNLLENREVNKILCRGSDMFKKLKINDGVKVTKKDNKEESKLKHGNFPEKNDPEFYLGPNVTPAKFKHRNIPVTNNAEHDIGPCDTTKIFQPEFKHISALEELVKILFEKIHTKVHHVMME